MLRLYSAGNTIPHPRKAWRGGEDSFIVSSPTNSTLAVADGVGAWEDKGVNPRAFADQILRCTYEFLKAGDKNPMFSLEAGFHNTNMVGSSTVCIGKMTGDGIFRVANIGDSGFLIIRDEKILLESTEHQHEFNYPYQIGRDEEGEPHGTDRPADAQYYQITLEEGDVVVMGSDGLFDNVWPKEILKTINNHPLNAIDLAERLSILAYDKSQDRDSSVPFFHRAKISNVEFSSYQGGKEDDITVLVGIVGND